MADKQTIHEKTEALVQMTKAFCEAHLDEEYRDLTERLIRKMSRKREVPYKRGKLDIWGAASVYAIGQINFLFDKSHPPYVSPDDIATHFGVNKSTLSQKAKKIRDLLKLRDWDPEFSTKHMLDSNPFDKLMMIDNFILHSGKLSALLERAREFSEMTIMPMEESMPLPRTVPDWVEDAEEAMNVAIQVLNQAMQAWGKTFTAMDTLFIAPHVFFAWRGQDLPNPKRDEVVKMMLRNYSATLEHGEGGEWLADSPFHTFAFCWLLCHMQAGLIEEDVAEHVMDCCLDEEMDESDDDNSSVENQFELVDLDDMEEDTRDWDAHEARVRKILGNEEDWEEQECRKQYTEHLRQNLKLPCEVTGIEDFRWEEFYVLGPGDKQEYAELKKERPSYKDIFELLAIDPEWSSEWVMHHGLDIGADVRRISDGKEFTLGLSELKTADTNDQNHQLLDDYAVWFVNGML